MRWDVENIITMNFRHELAQVGYEIFDYENYDNSNKYQQNNVGFARLYWETFGCDVRAVSGDLQSLTSELRAHQLWVAL